jgi:hypothetical protein
VDEKVVMYGSEGDWLWSGVCVACSSSCCEFCDVGGSVLRCFVVVEQLLGQSICVSSMPW